MERLRNTENHPFNKSTCQAIARTVFSRTEVNDVHILPGGIINSSIELSLRNPNTQLHLRVYNGEDAEVRASKEKLLYDLIAKHTNVPIPTIYSLDSSRTAIDQIFSLQSSLPGVNLESVCGKLTAEEQKSIAFQVGGYRGQLHTIRFRGFGEEVSKNTLGHAPTWGKFFLEFVSKNIDWCEDQGTIDGNLADNIKNHLLRWQRLLPEDQPAVLVHRDFHPGNIKVQKDRKGKWKISDIYDFEHAIAGHAEFDFAKPYWTFFEPYPQMKESMLRGYNDVNKLSPLFELRMDKLYRLAEISDFLVFGIKRGIASEIAKNLSAVTQVLREDT